MYIYSYLDYFTGNVIIAYYCKWIYPIRKKYNIIQHKTPKPQPNSDENLNLKLIKLKFYFEIL